MQRRYRNAIFVLVSCCLIPVTVEANTAVLKTAQRLARLRASRAAVRAAELQRSLQVQRLERARVQYTARLNAERTALAQQKQFRGIASAPLPVRRRAPAIANDLYKKPNVRFDTPARQTLAKNRIQGKVAEMRAYTDLRAAGYKVRQQVSARIGSQGRRIDFVVTHPSTNHWFGVEVKSGNAARSYRQASFDSKMATGGAVVHGKNAPSALRGQVVIMPTHTLNY